MKKRAKCIATGCEGETGFSGAALGSNLKRAVFERVRAWRQGRRTGEQA